MPKYLNNVHGYNTQMSGFLSTLPTLLRWICIVLQAPLVAWFGDPFLKFLVSSRFRGIVFPEFIFGPKKCLKEFIVTC